MLSFLSLCHVVCVQDAGSVSCAALVAVLSLLFRRSVRADVAVVAEVEMDGGLHSPALTDGTLVSLCMANGVATFITTESAAQRLRDWKQRHPRQGGGVAIVGVKRMEDVMRHFFNH